MALTTTLSRTPTPTLILRFARLELGSLMRRTARALGVNRPVPMALDELSQHIGLSRRQLERLFKKYLNCVPTRYYLQLRLERARQLELRFP